MGMKRQSMVISFSTKERLTQYQADQYVVEITRALILGLENKPDLENLRVSFPVMNQDTS